jgi:hypothetical protein
MRGRWLSQRWPRSVETGLNGPDPDWRALHLFGPPPPRITYKREREIQPLRLRPHPLEFGMYFDI